MISIIKYGLYFPAWELKKYDLNIIVVRGRTFIIFLNILDKYSLWSGEFKKDDIKDFDEVKKIISEMQ